MSDFIIAYAPTKRKDYFAENPYNFFNLPDFAAFWAKKWWDIPKKRPRRAGALSFPPPDFVLYYRREKLAEQAPQGGGQA